MKNKSNILIIHNYYKQPGGEDTVVENEYQLLKNAGHNVFLYTKSNKEIENYNIIKKILLPFTFICNLKTFQDVKQIIKEKSIDIIHVHNTLNLISPSVYYAAFLSKIPVVQTIHNFRLLCPAAVLYRDGHICEDCIMYSLLASIKHKCYRNSRLETLACAISLKINRLIGTYQKLNYICLTEFNKRKLLNLNCIKKDKVFVKPNFIISKRDIIPFQKRKKQIIFAGRIDYLKGITFLIQAWELLGDNAPLLKIYGTGPMEAWCKHEIMSKKIKSIEFMGYLEHEKLMDKIANSYALILPTQWYEGFPMSIIEAFSVGTPVLGSNMGNVGDLIQEGVTGWKFDSTSPKDIARAVKQIRDITESIYEVFQNQYNSSRNYSLLTAIYDEVQMKGYK